MHFHPRPQGSEFRKPCGRDFAQKGSDRVRKDMRISWDRKLDFVGLRRGGSHSAGPPARPLLALRHRSRFRAAAPRAIDGTRIRSPRKRFSSVTACQCAAFLKRQWWTSGDATLGTTAELMSAAGGVLGYEAATRGRVGGSPRVARSRRLRRVGQCRRH